MLVERTPEEGILEIEHAKWEKDKWGCLNLHVRDQNGYPVHAWLQLRPTYCDRGHIDLKITGLELDEQDSFPRYFFTAEEAKTHTKTYLLWKIWKKRLHPHTLD